MKRFLINILAAILMITCLSFAAYTDRNRKEEHHLHIHIYEIEAAGEYGSCPYCGQSLDGTPFTDRTCTEGTGYEAFCYNTSCSYYIDTGAPYATLLFFDGHPAADMYSYGNQNLHLYQMQQFLYRKYRCFRPQLR